MNKSRGLDRGALAEALKLLAAAPSEDDGGYVHLQQTPYRGHHLLASAVLMSASPGSTVLEGGVSSGYFARVLTSAGMTVDGFELDPVAAAEAEAVCRHVTVGDLQQLEPAQLCGPYDVVVFGDTLEHIDNPAAVLARLQTVMNTRGTLVVSIPNIANWAIRLQLLMGRFRYTDRGILDRTHVRFYTESTLVEMIQSAGYRVEDIVGSIPVPFVRNEMLCRLAHRVGNLRRSLFAYTFIVRARVDTGER